MGLYRKKREGNGGWIKPYKPYDRADLNVEKRERNTIVMCLFVVKGTMTFYDHMCMQPNAFYCLTVDSFYLILFYLFISFFSEKYENCCIIRVVYM